MASRLLHRAVRMAARAPVARGLTTGMARVSATGVQTARTFAGFSQKAAAVVAGRQQRYMSAFKDEYDDLVAERAGEGLVPRPLNPAQTAALVEMLKVGPHGTCFPDPQAVNSLVSREVSCARCRRRV